MSLNSLQDDMSRRAASMAAMARRANNPQEIQAIQKSLVAGVQNGSIQPYVGIPLIQDLTKKLAEATAKMAQSVAGAGMPQPPADGPPIAQQVMQQAAQESQGVEALPSNLPQSYAGGGIIAFEDGGKVERYQNKGLVSDDEQTKRNKEREAQARRDRAALLTLPAAAGDILAGPYNYLAQTGEAAANAIGVPRLGRALGIYDSDVNSVGIPRIGAGGNTPYSDMLNRYAAGDSTAPPPTPAANPYDPATATRRSAYTDAPIPGAAPGAAPSAAPGAASSAAIPGAGGFKNPILQTYAPTAATLPVRTMKDLTDLDAITRDAEAKKKTAFDTKAAASLQTLEDFDEPGNAAREEKYSKREAAQAKNSAIDRALNIMNLGFGVAGSREGTLAGALNREGREGIRDLLKGEAANRAAKDKLDDARDNFEQQKVAAKKGNYQAAQTAGREASQDVQAAIQLALAGAQAGNAQAISLYNTLTQGDIGRAGVLNQAEQLKLSGVEQQNRNVLGLAGLDVERLKINQSAASANATLAANEKRYAAMGEADRARIMQATAKGLNDFMQNEGGMLRAQLAKEYGANFMTAKDARSLEAQRIFNQRKQAYLADIAGQAMDAMSARSADALLGD